jgi:hypothetical protein
LQGQYPEAASAALIPTNHPLLPAGWFFHYLIFHKLLSYKPERLTLGRNCVKAKIVELFVSLGNKGINQRPKARKEV